MSVKRQVISRLPTKFFPAATAGFDQIDAGVAIGRKPDIWPLDTTECEDMVDWIENDDQAGTAIAQQMAQAATMAR